MPTKIDQMAVAIEANLSEYIVAWGLDMLAEFQQVVILEEVGAWEAAMKDITDGIERRLSMGADSFSWQGYQLGRVEQIAENGNRFNWVLDGGADHCDTCIAYAAGGPYTLSALPGIPGDAPTDCNGGCRCDLVEVAA